MVSGRSCGCRRTFGRGPNLFLKTPLFGPVGSNGFVVNGCGRGRHSSHSKKRRISTNSITSLSPFISLERLLWFVVTPGHTLLGLVFLVLNYLNS